MNKRGKILVSNIIFIVLTVLFFALLFIFVAWKSSGAAVYEEAYAKQIALLIDEAKPGTEISLDVSKLSEQARKNKFNGEIIDIDSESRKVSVILKEGGGYSFRHFSDNTVVWGYNPETETLDMRIN
ncbi:MAG: hypothetical protein AABX71_03025 [Nanoarchaeota archaeon]